MRPLLFLILFCLSLCTGLHADAPQTKRRTAADKAVIIAALTHFSTAALRSDSRSVSKKVLMVNRHYQTNKFYISSTQLRAERFRERWTVPEDARRDMERRTEAKERFSMSRLPSFIRLFDGITHWEDDVAFTHRYPDAKCYIELWPPGYTREGKRAIVRFSFGPTPHGANATYLLELRDGRWHVLRHTLGYYA